MRNDGDGDCEGGLVDLAVLAKIVWEGNATG
jgi:hypothetical protein